MLIIKKLIVTFSRKIATSSFFGFLCDLANPEKFFFQSKDFLPFSLLNEKRKLHLAFRTALVD
jgi:hypothetical protein